MKSNDFVGVHFDHCVAIGPRLILIIDDLQ